VRTQFATWGNSLACRIPAALARAIAAAPGKAAAVSVQGGRPVIALVDDVPA
jgi:antitoxin component of MazEF toxin-antitoxin module